MDYYSYNESLPDNLNFSIDEIREQLANMGYADFNDESLMSIKNDLDNIITNDLPGKQQSNYSNDWFINFDDKNGDETSLASVTTLSQDESSQMKRKVFRPSTNHSYQNQVKTDNYTINNNQQYTDVDNNSNRKVCFPQDPVDDIFNYTKVSIDPNEFGLNTNRSRKAGTGGLIKYDTTSGAANNSLWKRHDPVTRYHSYRAAWSKNKTPGESPHKALRWQVKAAMMVKEVPRPKSASRSSSVGSNRQNNLNSIPGENRHHELRWEVRQKMANPDVFFD